MKHKWGIVFFGLIEVAIGSITLFSVILSFLLGKSAKPAEVLAFVLVTSAISLGLGIGILRRSLASYHLAIFFSLIVIFSKLLIFARIISLSGALETSVPPAIKNIISVVYHILLLWYFTRKESRAYFRERRNVFFSLKLPQWGEKSSR